MVLAIKLIMLCLSNTRANQRGLWSNIVQSSNSQPHNRSGQLKDLGYIPWTTIRQSEHHTAVAIDAQTRRQIILGFGGAFTEAAGFAWGKLSHDAQQTVLREYWGADGTRYTLGRVAMNSPDFALSHYSYANDTADFELRSFQNDLRRDSEWVIPFIRAAINTSNKTGRTTGIRLFSAPWSPPAWMKVPFDRTNASEPNSSHIGAMDVCRPNSLLSGHDVNQAWALYFSKW